MLKLLDTIELYAMNADDLELWCRYLNKIIDRLNEDVANEAAQSSILTEWQKYTLWECCNTDSYLYKYVYSLDKYITNDGNMGGLQ